MIKGIKSPKVALEFNECWKTVFQMNHTAGYQIAASIIPAGALLKNYICQGLNSHYFHIIGDGKLNPIVGVYIPIIRIPIKRWDDHPQYCDF